MAETYSTQEGWHTVKDGTKLYTKTWTPTGAVQAKLAFVHGFSDHCNAYFEFFPALAARGIEVFSFDQRGWGRSVARPSQKGLTGPTSLVFSDLTSFLTPLLPPPTPYPSASSNHPTAPPLFLMGHSMGGAIILSYMYRGPSHVTRHITGYLGEAPYLALHQASRPGRGVALAGRVASKLSPHSQIVRPLDEKLLSRDPEIQRAFVEDKLCHDTGTLEGLKSMMERAQALMEGKARRARDQQTTPGEELRIWVGHGTEDRITDPVSTKKWVESLGDSVKDKEFKAYEGWYHKLHAEPGEDKIIFAKDVADWIIARVPQGVPAAGDTQINPEDAKSKL